MRWSLAVVAGWVFSGLVLAGEPAAPVGGDAAAVAKSAGASASASAVKDAQAVTRPAAAAAAAAPSAPAVRAAQLKCPVTGKARAEIAKPYFMLVDGFVFWLADAEAAKTFQDKSADAFAALAKNGDAAEPISQACPVMGNLVNKALFVAKDGRRIYVCCKGCLGRVDKNWDAMVKKVAQQAKDGDPKDLKPM